MQGFISHSVYWVAFCGVIHGSLFFKSRWGLRGRALGTRVEGYCAEHINTAVRSTPYSESPQ